MSNLALVSAAILIPSFLFALACVLATIYLCLWVHADAKAKGIENPALWVLVVLLVPNLIGLIIYLVFRHTRNRTSPCPECGHSVAESIGFCPRCGAKQPPLPAAQSIQATPGKEKKRLKLFLVFLIIAVIAGILMIASVIGMNLLIPSVGSDTYMHSSSSSTIEWAPEYTFRSKHHANTNDSASLTFESFQGTYRLLKFRSDGGDHIITLDATHDGEPLTFALRDENGVETSLPTGESAHDLPQGLYSVIMYGEECFQGNIEIQVALDK